jgi:hypothetical protein
MARRVHTENFGFDDPLQESDDGVPEYNIDELSDGDEYGRENEEYGVEDGAGENEDGEGELINYKGIYFNDDAN